MISLFRRFFQSKIGLPIFIGFLAIVALAFAASDITGSATFGGLSGDDNVVVVGGESVSSTEMSSAINNGLDRARQQNPTLTMPQFVEQGGFDSEVDLLIDRKAVGQFAEMFGLRAGTNLINSEILQIGAFRNLTGEFDQESYQAALRRQNLTDSMLREDIRDGLLNQLILRPAFAAPRLPRAAARQYAALLLERRLGNIALIPSRDYAPDGDPTNEQLSAYYSENRADFVVPERRTIRYVTFGADSVNIDLTPTEEQIAARYQADAASYEAQERRAISSFVVPTEQAARALVARIRSGVSLEAAAAQAGFNVSSAPLQDRETLAGATSFALGQAVFEGERGAVVEPAQAQLGWYVARVDEVENTPARTLAQARDEIAQLLQDEARSEALLDLSERIEQEVDGGASLTDVATEFGLEIASVSNVTADGRIYDSLGEGIAPALRPLLSTAFQMEESEPQLAEMVPGTVYMIFDVGEIVESAAPPLAEVRDEAVEGWRRSEGSKAAKAAAERIIEDVRGGTSLPNALRAENSALNQLERIDIERRQLFADPQRRVPTALVLMFSMASGSTKLLEERGNLGWFIIDLDEIVIPDIDNDNPVLDDTQAQIATALGLEYNLQLFRAIREEVGVERNEDAILALRRTLSGEN
ncbi:MAG: peptidylprolyl isomerase [Erythrobacter sp.]